MRRLAKFCRDTFMLNRCNYVDLLISRWWPYAMLAFTGIHYLPPALFGTAFSYSVEKVSTNISIIVAELSSFIDCQDSSVGHVAFSKNAKLGLPVRFAVALCVVRAKFR